MNQELSNKLKLNWVTDIIGKEYKQWNNKKTILINSQTGTGKTYFTINKLMEYAYKQGMTVLYLCNRLYLKRQTKIEIGKSQFIDMSVYSNEKLDKLSEIGNVRIETYQNLTNQLYDKRYGKNKYDCDYSQYDYIVYDECHYVFQDANFNNKTTFFFDDFLMHPDRKNSVNIFISATIGIMKNKILDKCDMYKDQIIYNTGRDYSYIMPYYFKKVEDMINLINSDESDNKWLVIASLAKCEKFLDGIENSRFICSEHNNNKNKKIMNEEEKFKLIQEGLFDCKCLVATKAIDNGVSFNDYKLTNIVIITTDYVDFLQMVGRKRVNINDAQKVNLYIMDQGVKTFSSQLNSKLLKTQELIELYKKDIVSFNHKFDSNLALLGKNSALFYRDNLDDSENGRLNNFKINKTCATHNELKILYYESMCKYLKIDKLFYLKTQLYWIGKEYNSNNWIYGEEDMSINNLNDYLEELFTNETKLFKDGQSKLKSFISEDFDNMIVKLQGRKTDREAGINILNKLFVICDVPYIIMSKVENSRNSENYKKRFWIIEKNN